MLSDRIIYFGLIGHSADVKSLIDRLPDDFTDINMLLVTPTVGRANSVDIQPYNQGKRFTIENTKIPEGAEGEKTLKDEINAFKYAEGHYRILKQNLLV